MKCAQFLQLVSQFAGFLDDESSKPIFAQWFHSAAAYEEQITLRASTKTVSVFMSNLAWLLSLHLHILNEYV